MSTIIPSEDDATHQYDNSGDEAKNADRCGCDDCRSDLLRPHAIAIPYNRSFRKAFVPRARTGGLSGIALMEAIQESLQESFKAHRVAMTSARLHTGQAEAGTSCQAKVGTLRQALPSSHPDYSISAPKRRRLKRDRVSTHSDK
jgi:hypothetical protein